jgi:hypothetical protein
VRAVGGINGGLLREIYRANLRLRKYNHIIMHAQNKKTFRDRNGEIKLVPQNMIAKNLEHGKFLIPLCAEGLGGKVKVRRSRVPFATRVSNS